MTGPEIINDAGKLAGSISAIFALLTLVLWKPIKNRITKRKTAIIEKKKADDMERLENEEFRRRVLEALETISDDVAELQRDRLCQMHDFYTRQGWCPSDKKREIVDWHAKYTKKGRNHLANHYEEDILELPNYPPDDC